MSFVLKSAMPRRKIHGLNTTNPNTPRKKTLWALWISGDTILTIRCDTENPIVDKNIHINPRRVLESSIFAAIAGVSFDAAQRLLGFVSSGAC